MKYFSIFCRYFISYSFFVITNSKLWALKVQNLQTKTEINNIYVRLKTDLSLKNFKSYILEKFLIARIKMTIRWANILEIICEL